jgi:hypothetical protein
MTNAEIFAAWLIHARRTTDGTSFFPSDAEVKEIVNKKEGRYHEAHAAGQAFVAQVLSSKPEGVTETFDALKRAMQGVHGVSEKVGSALSLPPVGTRGK